MRARNENEWSSFMREVNGYNGDTPRDKVLDWALQNGISLDKINAYRHAMIDGQPEDLTAPKAQQ